MQSVGGEGVSGVHDAIAVTLLGQEALTVGRELLVEGVACHHGVEPGGPAVALRSEQPAQALGLLLA